MHVTGSLGTAWVVVLATACSSPSLDRGRLSERDGSAEASGVEAPRVVSMTLWPFHEIPLEAQGWGQPLPLGGVEVCAAYARPIGGPRTWSDFVELHGRCATTVEGQNVVLRDLPGSSELIVTATKAGFRSAAYAVTTSAWSEDITAALPQVDTAFFSLLRQDALQRIVSPDVTLSTELGFLCAYTTGAGIGANGPAFGFLGGARVSLDAAPEGSSGPYYYLRGEWVASAQATVPGELGVTQSYPGTAFVNLPAGEYALHVDAPDFFCGAFGANAQVEGFAAPRSSLRAPILPGYVTSIVANCVCQSSDGGRCPFPGDAGP